MKSILIALFSLIYTATKGQVEIVPAVDTSLFIGINNFVELKSKKIPLQQLQLQTNNGVVSGKNGLYLIRCSSYSPSALITVIYKKRIVATKLIKINFISDPVAFALGDSVFFNNGSITKKQLLNLKSIHVKINYPLAKFIVLKFTTEIIHAQNSKGIIENNSFLISDDIKFFLKNGEPGDEIIFDNIVCISPDSLNRFLMPIKLKIIQ